MSELVFADIFSAVNDSIGERRASDEPHLEQPAHKTFDDSIEARVGELITNDFQKVLLDN